MNKEENPDLFNLICGCVGYEFFLRKMVKTEEPKSLEWLKWWDEFKATGVSQIIVEREDVYFTKIAEILTLTFKKLGFPVPRDAVEQLVESMKNGPRTVFHDPTGTGSFVYQASGEYEGQTPTL